MKRLARILINALTVLSFLVGVGTVALWPRSYIARDWLDPAIPR